MIQILGPKRILILLVLFGVNAFLAFVLYYQLMPQKATAERQLQGARGQASSTQADIDKLMIEFDQLQQQQARYNALESDGFISNQSRRQAERLLQEIQTESGVVAASANIKAANVQADETAAKAGYVVLSSPIEVSLEAMDDLDLYRYYAMLMERFPGHISVDKIFINRELDISNPVLRAIAAGENIALVKADLTLSWKTMMPEADVADVIGEGRQNIIREDQ